MRSLLQDLVRPARLGLVVEQGRLGQLEDDAAIVGKSRLRELPVDLLDVPEAHALEVAGRSLRAMQWAASGRAMGSTAVNPPVSTGLFLLVGKPIVRRGDGLGRSAGFRRDVPTITADEHQRREAPRSPMH